MILMVTANWQNYYIKHAKIAWDNAKLVGRAHTITTPSPNIHTGERATRVLQPAHGGRGGSWRFR